jgi:hypothetical protein
MPDALNKLVVRVAVGKAGFVEDLDQTLFDGVACAAFEARCRLSDNRLYDVNVIGLDRATAPRTRDRSSPLTHPVAEGTSGSATRRFGTRN